MARESPKEAASSIRVEISAAAARAQITVNTPRGYLQLRPRLQKIKRRDISHGYCRIEITQVSQRDKIAPGQKQDKRQAENQRNKKIRLSPDDGVERIQKPGIINTIAPAPIPSWKNILDNE